LSCAARSAPGLVEQFGRAEDQERRGGVADLECTDADEHAPKSALEHGSDVEPDRLAFAPLEPRGGADGVNDCGHREQTGNDREEDRTADSDERDEGEREQRPADRAEVVHRPLVPVGTPERTRRHHIGKERVP
jgi:hypothetical protein